MKSHTMPIANIRTPLYEDALLLIESQPLAHNVKVQHADDACALDQHANCGMGFDLRASDDAQSLLDWAARYDALSGAEIREDVTSAVRDATYLDEEEDNQ